MGHWRNPEWGQDADARAGDQAQEAAPRHLSKVGRTGGTRGQRVDASSYVLSSAEGMSRESPIRGSLAGNVDRLGADASANRGNNLRMSDV